MKMTTNIVTIRESISIKGTSIFTETSFPNSICGNQKYVNSFIPCRAIKIINRISAIIQNIRFPFDCISNGNTLRYLNLMVI
jgi:hypothetical protein